MAEGDISAREVLEDYQSPADAAIQPFVNAIAAALERRVGLDGTLSRTKVNELRDDIETAGRALSQTPEAGRANRMERLVTNIRMRIFGEGSDTPPGVIELRARGASTVPGRTPGIDSAFIPAELEAALEETARHPVMPVPAAPANGASHHPSGTERMPQRPPRRDSPVVIFKPSPFYKKPGEDSR